MRIAINHRASRGRRRAVVVVIELLFVFPILLMFVLAIVQIYMIVTAREEMLAASRLGARVAAAGDYDNREEVKSKVDKTVHRALGRGRLGSCNVRVTWAQDLKSDQTRGEADWVRVSLSVPTRRVVPDLLGWIGFTLGHHKLVVATTMKQE
jgi:hypothetical protein